MDNPVTPAQAATPGTPDPKNPNPAPTAPAVEPKMEISQTEYAQLQRDRARLQAFQKRAALTPTRRPAAAPARNAADPDQDLNDEVVRVQGEKAVVERELLDERIKTRTRDLLDKPEYKDLPESTKRLILKNPASLSEANDVDSALSDIEDFLLNEALPAAPKPVAPAPAAPAPEPRGVETPRHVGRGAPSAPGASEMEDTSRLNGQSRSRATLRNLLRQAR